eukprot:28736-Chlamydomonas_euryale.AAC.1
MHLSLQAATPATPGVLSLANLCTPWGSKLGKPVQPRDGWTDAWVGGWTYGRTEGWMDEWMAMCVGVPACVCAARMGPGPKAGAGAGLRAAACMLGNGLHVCGRPRAAHVHAHHTR